MQFNLRQKMAIIVFAVAVSFALLTGLTWFLDAETESQTAAIRDHYIPQVELGYKLDTEFDGVRLALRDAVSTQDLGQLDWAETQKEKLLSDVDTATAILDKDQIAELKTTISDYFAIALDTSKRLINGETGLEIVESMKQMQAKHAVALDALKRATHFDRAKLADAFSAIFVAQEKCPASILDQRQLCSFVFAITLLIARSLMLRLSDIAKGVSRFGSGDFSDPIPIEGSDELSALSQQINKMAQQIQNLLKELESFSYSIAHDLRAPLRSILGFSSALLEDHGPAIPEDGKALLDRIALAAKRMSQMVDGLLNLSRLNRSSLNRQQVDLSSIARQAVGVLRQNEPERKIETEIQENLFASGDPRLLDMAISNLIGNAWKFTKNQPRPVLRFSSRRENGCETFFVKDNGAGFDMQYSDKLFGTFQRLHSEADFEGHGIGLATVKNIVEKHGGKIWAEGEPNKGATFYFNLG